jgi:hypothetical protein
MAQARCLPAVRSVSNKLMQWMLHKICISPIITSETLFFPDPLLASCSARRRRFWTCHVRAVTCRLLLGSLPWTIFPWPRSPVRCPRPLSSFQCARASMLWISSLQAQTSACTRKGTVPLSAHRRAAVCRVMQGKEGDTARFSAVMAKEDAHPCHD